MRKCLSLIALFIIFVLFPLFVFAVNESFLISYGFSAFSPYTGMGKVQGGNFYDFVQLAYSTEKPLYGKKLNLHFEPFISYVMRPQDGAEAGVSLSLRYYLTGGDDYKGFYLTAGTGGAYSSINFQEQGTHLFFILQGGIGYKWKNFFIEDRFRHYSNGGYSSPNRSIHANIISIGMTF